MSGGGGRDRLYWREGRGWYMDLRDVGGGQKACVPAGKRRATLDRDEATAILAARLKELREETAARDRKGGDPRLADYAKRHLKVKEQYRAASTVARDERALRLVLSYFGEDVRLSEIGVAELTDYLSYRRQQPGSRKGTTIAPQTLLHELHALSSLYKRAVAEGKAASNPVRALPEKPKVERGESEWLEPGEAARLIRAAVEADRDPHPRGVPFLGPMVATALLTGGRKEEVFGLLRRDVDFEGDGVIHFRENGHRGLKRARHRRHVALWPQLREILEAFLAEHPREPGDLLFPAPHGGMWGDLRGSLRSALTAAGIERRVTWHTLRHTYAATRLQTLDHGQPISPYTVMRELGHSSLMLIEKTYGHLQRTRHRSPVVEYREAEVVARIAGGAREAAG